ncbi:DOMON domain-containing protein FRRS1L [Crocuta crocuta]
MGRSITRGLGILRFTEFVDCRLHQKILMFGEFRKRGDRGRESEVVSRALRGCRQVGLSLGSPGFQQLASNALSGVGVTGGYPFPTAPPVDPFAKIKVDDCGKTKGCFRYGKPGCNAETCDYFLSYRMIGADVEFELSADTDGWVAVGFSSDKKMGGDDVMACVHDDNGRVRIQHFYNVGQWAKEIQRNPARDEEGVFENNRVTCRFKRPVNVPRDETIVDLHLSWYYLFAWGPAIQGSITRHDIDSPPTSERVVSIYKYEDIFMPSAAYQTFSSPFCLLLIVALTFYLLMGTP